MFMYLLTYSMHYSHQSPQRRTIQHLLRRLTYSTYISHQGSRDCERAESKRPRGGNRKHKQTRIKLASGTAIDWERPFCLEQYHRTELS